MDKSAQKGRGRAFLSYGFVAPALVVLIAINIFPLLYSIYLSFTNAALIGGELQIIGDLNYRIVFLASKYATALRTSALFVFLAVSTELLLGFFLALALRERMRGKGFLLTTLLVPMMLPQAVMGLYWKLVLNGNYGVLNQFLGILGLGQPQWISDPELKFFSVLVVDVWMWTPFMILISLAALNSIPSYLYEAAAIDRATPWIRFRRITLPMCAPLLRLAVLFRATDALKQFDLVMALTGPNDGATQTLSALLYQVVFRDGKVGLGAAYSYVVLVLVIALASVFVRYLSSLQQREQTVYA